MPSLPCRSQSYLRHRFPREIAKPCFVYKQSGITFPNSHIFYSSPKFTSKPSVYKRPIHRTHHPKFTHKSVVNMAGIFDGLSNLVSSIFEIFQGLISTVLSAIQSVFGLFQNLIASVFDLMSGLVGFILGMSSHSPSDIRCNFEK